jgi:NADPH:quinone reductase-like Zn-dependent oxidoreductase
MPDQTVWRVVEKKGPSGLKRLQESIPSPKAKQYLVRVHAVSLNFRDVAILNGTYGLGVKDNVVLGADMGGEIVEVGEGATKFKKGDRVTSLFNQTHFYGVPTESGMFISFLVCLV